jgi:perosamine synthetase
MSDQPFLAQQAGYRAIACPVADELWNTGLYLPSSCNLSDEQIASVIKAISEPLIRELQR